WTAATRAGWTGVDLFFVLSGFLVSGLLFREYQRYRELRGVPFLIRRGFKIYPAYYALILVTWVVDLSRGSRPGHYTGLFVCQLLYVQNYLGWRWGHTWSLAVEEHFYLLLTLALVRLSRRGGDDPFQGLARRLIGLGAAGLALRILLLVCVPQVGSRTHFMGTHVRLDELGWGVWLAWWYHYRPARLAEFVARRRALLWALVVAGWLPPLLATSAWQWRYVLSFGFTGLSFGSLALILLALHPAGPRRPGPAVRALARIGFHSYSIYLLHEAVGLGIVRLAPGGWLPKVDTWATLVAAGAVHAAACIAAGTALGLGLEQPVLRLRDRICPSRAGGVRSAPASDPTPPEPTGSPPPAPG
ncbi:MAG: acyltransferase, partial [Armatimonadetes bacterium]|nr:acyltransferase [Armatimonadota bacterium]